MNTFTGVVTYVGDTFTDSGLRFMQLNVPKIGSKGEDAPLYMLPTKACGETFDMLSPGAKLLINGRLYPSRQDYKMYFIANQPLQIVQGLLNLNKVNLSGGMSEIGPENKKVFDGGNQCLNFSLMCNAPAQQMLNHSWQDSLGFRIEAWNTDCERIERLGQRGRFLTLEGTLRYNTWTTKEGQKRGAYSVRTRSGLYNFGKPNKNMIKEEVKNTYVTSSTVQGEAPVVVTAEPYQSAVNQSKEVNTTPKTADSSNLPF